jgi:hypothetical protein
MVKFKALENKRNYAVGRHNKQVDYRWWDPTIRGLWNIWRRDAQADVLA